MSFGDNGRTDLKNGLDRDVRQVSSSDPGHIFENTIIMTLMPANQGDNFTSPRLATFLYDVITGKLKWTFHSVPHPGEVGYETWPAEAWKTSGGVHNWNEMAVDGGSCLFRLERLATISMAPTGMGRIFSATVLLRWMLVPGSVCGISRRSIMTSGTTISLLLRSC